MLAFEAVQALLVGLDDLGYIFDDTHDPLSVLDKVLYMVAKLLYLLAELLDPLFVRALHSGDDLDGFAQRLVAFREPVKALVDGGLFAVVVGHGCGVPFWRRSGAFSLART